MSGSIDFITRYGSDEMRAIFSKENWLKLMLKVEVALAKALWSVGLISEEAYLSIKRGAKEVSLQRVKEIEKQIMHETMAVVMALAEKSGNGGKYVHLGATSNDILDTVMALQILSASKLMEGKMIRLLELFCNIAENEKDTICLGRTHGRAAVPMVFGFKFAVYASEIARNLDRLRAAVKRAAVGKICGAVGTMAELGEIGFKIQKIVMESLGIPESDINTQVVPRDRIAEFLLVLALISSSLEKIANEIRNLQRSEIEEVFEPFGRKQIGSSTMPHKRNPIMSERICGLARVLRGITVGSLENIVLEHERDLTNSSFERVIIPQACLLVDEQLSTAIKIFSNLEIRRDRMKKNLLKAGLKIMSENIMIKAVLRGADRQRSLNELREISLKAKNDDEFLDLVLKNDYIRGFLSEEEIRKALDYNEYTKTAKIYIEKIVNKIRREYLS